MAGDTLNITYNFLYCNHQVHRDFLITLYKAQRSWQNLLAELAHHNNTFKATGVERLLLKKTFCYVFYVKAFVINAVCLNVGQHLFYMCIMD
jgi:hypothetical protein